MFYILNKAGQIIGSADGPVDVEDLASRGESIIASETNVPPDRAEVLGFPTNPIVAERKRLISAPKIVLTTAAKDADGDGLPEIPANGRTKAAITATLQDAEGGLLQEP